MLQLPVSRTMRRITGITTCKKAIMIKRHNIIEEGLRELKQRNWLVSLLIRLKVSVKMYWIHLKKHK